MKPLTQKQIECLRIAAQRDVNPFDFGSTTIARLKREGLIALVDGARARRYRITDAGRAELAAPTTMQKSNRMSNPSTTTTCALDAGARATLARFIENCGGCFPASRALGIERASLRRAVDGARLRPGTALIIAAALDRARAIYPELSDTARHVARVPDVRKVDALHRLDALRGAQPVQGPGALMPSTTRQFWAAVRGATISGGRLIEWIDVATIADSEDAATVLARVRGDADVVRVSVCEIREVHPGPARDGGAS